MQHSELDREIGNRVRAARLNAKLSQTKLADLIGVSFQQVQKYEAGENRIAASRLVEIANVLAVPSSSFLSGPEHTERASSSSVMSARTYKLVQLFDSLENDKVRQKILELVRALANDDSTRPEN